MKRLLVPLAGFTGMTVVMTWPQTRFLSTLASQHQDVYFNMWRLRWFAHAIVSAPGTLFDANIFSPERRTLALSDAMLVEGAVAAPLTWLNANPVLVHNITLLAAIMVSAVAAFALAHYLTGSRGAGAVAGMVFAYAPYRFEHYMHMELQWGMWAPLAFLALHRLCDTGRARWGLALGACVALQMLSSIYYGIFLATLLCLGVPLFVLADQPLSLRRMLKPLASGGVLAVIVCGVYARPYLWTRQHVGDRAEREVATYSARPGDYLSATENNWMYGETASRGWPERHLFPGFTPFLLAVIAVFANPSARRQGVYLVLLAAAFELSLGVHGVTYGCLYEHIPVFRGLRATARLALFVLLFLSVLAAYGYAWLARGRPRPFRYALCAVCVGALAVEYHVTLTLVPFPTEAPPVYRLLRSQPKGVVAEFPVPVPWSLPGADAGYAYASVFHWFPLVNGYSGTYPRSYLARLEQLKDFPSEAAIRQLRRDDVRYVLVHANGYDTQRLQAVLAGMDRSGSFFELGSFPDADAPAWLFRLR